MNAFGTSRVVSMLAGLAVPGTTVGKVRRFRVRASVAFALAVVLSRSEVGTGQDQTLSVGQSATVTIRANEPYNYTHIRLVKGKRYRFTVDSPGWNNGTVATDAGGYDASAPYPYIRRHVDYKFMALVGEIFHSERNPTAWTGRKFLIGLGRDSYTAAADGYLVAFANDCLVPASCYVDNSRVVTLTVKRIE